MWCGLNHRGAPRFQMGFTNSTLVEIVPQDTSGLTQPSILLVVYTCTLDRVFVILLFRVGTPLTYFISELLYVPQNNLTDMRTIALQVATVTPLTTTPFKRDETIARTGDLVTDGKDSSCTSPNECPPSKKLKVDEPVSSEPASSEPETVKILSSTASISAAISNCSAWILDIDLDFFSTENPFTTMFNEVSSLPAIVYY